MHELTNFIKFFDNYFFKILNKIAQIVHKKFVALLLLTFLIITFLISL